MLYFHRLASAGGAERMLCRLAEALVSYGAGVDVVSWDDAAANSFHALPSGVTWHRLGYTPGLRDKARRARELTGLLRRMRADVLVGFVMSADRTVYAACRMAGVALIVAERNAPSMYRFRHGMVGRAMIHASLHLADAVVVQFASFVKHYPPTLRRRMRVIGNPVDVAARVPARPSCDGRHILLFCGRLDPLQKRPQIALDAFARIAHEFPDWDLRIVGGGPAAATLREAAAKHGLSSRVRIDGARSDLADVFAQADLFVLPSAFEGFPNVLAEAMAAGLPAIAFESCAGAADLLALGGGWLVGDADPVRDLAETLRTAMLSPSERAARGARARQGMKALAATDAFAPWADLVRQVVDGRRG
ncbi:glycosyltransferase [Salinarimonas ramus]|uniref:Glycosyl transferase family 1 n=1 Tax=Salinarimonas ramus TaxID=690164 RepID=A0A917QFU9_9HYPH|nr:glycosyltransferase [Salinarimonas ramus]GGK47031.1 glycosyl transferase family 1 [Salinarimonas ramus]